MHFIFFPKLALDKIGLRFVKSLIQETPVGLPRVPVNSIISVPVRHKANLARKKYFGKSNVIFHDGKYQITLNQKTLRTPKGNRFYVENEALALAIAAEWDAQKNNATPGTMHLTSLCNTAIDNPNMLTREDIIHELINFLQMDTVLFHSGENDELIDHQRKEWTPVITWFCKRFDIDVQAVRNIDGPLITSETKDVISRYIQSFDIWALHGFKYVTDSLKSLILAICCYEKHISVENAVLLSILEEEFQSRRWGWIEYAHELNKLDLQARVSAGVLFIYASSHWGQVKVKMTW